MMRWTGREGYVSARANRDRAGNATAPAARRNRLLRRIFMTPPPACRMLTEAFRRVNDLGPRATLRTVRFAARPAQARNEEAADNGLPLQAAHLRLLLLRGRRRRE